MTLSVWFACLFLWAGFSIMVAGHFVPGMNVRLGRYVCYLSLFVGICLLGFAQAHARNINGEYDNSPNQAWFASQHNSHGGYCCNSADGHEYDGDYKMNQDGSVTLELDIGPYMIDAWKVLKGHHNPTGHAVWWYNRGPGQTINTYCFAMGPLT